VPYWFHATEEKNVESILKEGFRANTFFGKHIEECLTLGCGEVMFWLWFDEHPTKYWEWVTRKPIGPECIRAVARMKPELLYENKALELEMRRKFHEEMYPGTVLCGKCEGRGELTQAPFFRVKNRPCEACPDCRGFGSLNKDGTRVNYPKGGMLNYGDKNDK